MPSKPSFNGMPPAVMERIIEIAEDSGTNAGIKAMMGRYKEDRAFASSEAAMLAGIGIIPRAKAELDSLVDRLNKAQTPRLFDKEYAEVIIGGGLHAAIYSAVRVSRGYQKPLVIEAGDTVGGAFNYSKSPSFYLNSRNRPGNLGLPGERGGLNVLPGAVLQPADLSASEYQRNSDLAYVIRITLTQHADVMVGTEVVAVDVVGDVRGRYRITTRDGRLIYTERVIDSRGLGKANKPQIRSNAERIMSFPEFMATMDEQFPLRNLRRVAVVGDGDSGKTVVEALLGIGPSEHWSVPTLDWVERIDWYGTSIPETCEDWEQVARSRYQRIGRFLPGRELNPGEQLFPTSTRSSARVVPYQVAGSVSSGYDQAYVNERPYDAVIICTGFTRDGIDIPALADMSIEGGVSIARRSPSEEVYAVGPAAELEYTTQERTNGITRIAENRTALFRLAGKTASLASRLSGAAKRREPVAKKASRAKKSTEVDPVVERELVGRDKNGKKLYLGDRVNIQDGYPGNGTIDTTMDGGVGNVGVARDDKRPGGSPTRSWIVGLQDLVKLEDPVAKDRNGVNLYMGDRVRRHSSGETGIIDSTEGDSSRGNKTIAPDLLGVKMDAGWRGSSSTGSYVVSTSDLERI